MKITFEWDEEKAKRNFKKHGVNFEEAKMVFNDPVSITIPDPLHSDNEQRFIDIGNTPKGRVLVVAYTERGSNIRIISCRKAVKREKREYEEKEYKISRNR